MNTFVYVANSRKGGIGIYRLDRKDGSLIELGRHNEDSGLSPLAFSPDRRFLYAAVRPEPFSIAAFAVDAGTGELHFLNAARVPFSPTYMTVDAGGRFLLCASYGDNSLCVLALGREGMVQPEPVCTLRPGRNPHCVVVDPSNRFAYAPVLGSDHIAQYCFDAATGMLVPNHPPLAATAREAGPRHLVLSPDNRFAYVLTELGGEIVAYAVDREKGYLTETHSVPLLPPERSLPPGGYEPPLNRSGGGNSPTPVMWAADIRITPDGRFVYASERTNSTLSHFRVDPVSGRLDFAGITETEAQPRGFAMDPFGCYLVAAGEKSGHVSAYGIHEDDGGLSRTCRLKAGTAPNWVEIMVSHQ